jgi:hypothetical protein
MKRHTFVVLAAAITMAAATGQQANAQGRVYTGRQQGAAVQSQGQAPQRQMQSRQGAEQLPRVQTPARPGASEGYPPEYSDGYVGEEMMHGFGASHPEGARPSGGYSHGSYSSDSFSHGGYHGEGCGPDGCGSDGCGSDCYSDGCCDTCGSEGCGGECFARGGLSCNLFGLVCPPGRYFFEADWLYVRSNFSEAIAFVQQDDNQQGIATNTIHSLDFQYDSSYRLGGGYRLCNCGEEVRFYFTRLSSYANDVAPEGAFIPFEVTPTPGGTTFIHADVDVKTFDLEFAKTIPLGGRLACEDQCGCGDECGSACCPAWDVTWSGGLRFADVGWDRVYTAVDATDFVETQAISTMDFRGGGVKLGLEGRRYFCANGCLSMYLKGDLSLLLGDVDVTTTRRTDDPSTPTDADTLLTQTLSNRQIIPVTEIEAGVTGHVTCNTSVTTGYMFSAWHDLGFRDEFAGLTNANVSFLETGYDDANILGFDGFFARLEMAY